MTAYPARQLPVAPRLTSCVSTRDGLTFNPAEDVWVLSSMTKRHLIQFDRLEGLVTAELAMSVRQALVGVAPHVVGSMLDGWYRALCLLLTDSRRRPLDRIDVALVLDWNAKVGKTARTYFRTVRAFLKRWHALGIPGVDAGVVEALNTIRVKTEQIGVAVRTADPEKGPFTAIELQGIVTALRNAHADGEVSLADYVLVWLFIAIGARPAQLAALKLGDFSVTTASDNSRAYLIQVPRIKQKGQTIRTEFKTRPLVREIGETVADLVERQKEAFVGIGLETADIPLFGAPDIADGDRRALLYHPSTVLLSGRIKRLFARLDVRSERTGERLKVVARRFRYTKGTRLYAAGASSLAIAEALDHTNASHIGIYAAADPAVLDRISKAVALDLAPMAQAFLGQVIDHEGQAIRGGDLTARIRSADSAPVGSCGSYGFCGLLAPVACYTCRSFQPWLNGPHEEILDALLLERERVLTLTGEAAVAAANDRTILACAEVVRMCAERKGGAHG